MLADTGVVSGWWAVRREAQAALTDLRGAPEDLDRLQAEIQATLNNPAASVEEKNCAGFYFHTRYYFAA
jgi:hypothetical protein